MVFLQKEKNTYTPLMETKVLSSIEKLAEDLRSLGTAMEAETLEIYLGLAFL